MDINNLKRISFEYRKLTIYNKSGDSIKLIYGDYNPLREKIINFTTLLVKNQNNYLFSNYCSNCGNCCKRDNILIKGGDLFTIATHLGMKEEEFYEKYLLPACTWSDYDGFIKLIDGKCPFLEIKSSGRTICKIYDHRPEACRYYIPVSPLCHKDINDLIEKIMSIEVSGEELIIKLHSGEHNKLTLSDELKNKFSEILLELSKINPEENNSLQNIIKKINEILEDIKTGKINREDFHKNIKRLKNIIKSIWEERVVYSNEVDNLWAKLSELEMEIIYPEHEKEENNKLYETNDLINIEDFSLSNIMFSPLSMILTYSINKENYTYSFYYSEDSAILNSIRKLIKEVTLFTQDSFPKILDNHISTCYLCGECCRIFTVEIEPSDIRRLAEEFKLTDDDFRKKYILPGIYSWNPGSGVIKKIDYPNNKDCSFLTRGEMGYYYCSVHPFKPELCRNYKTGKLHCYRKITDDFYYRLSHNLQYIYLTPETLTLNTPYCYFKTKNPLEINWKKYSFLKDSIQSFLNNLKIYILQKYFSNISC